MQGACILAAGKPIEKDGSRSPNLPGVTRSNNDVFRNCLKRQNQQMDGADSQEPAASTGQDSKSGKLDRSALLRSPNLRKGPTVSNDSNEQTSREPEGITLDASSKAAQSITASRDPISDRSVDNTCSPLDQSADTQTEGSDLAAEAILSLVNQAGQPTGTAQLGAETSVDPLLVDPSAGDSRLSTVKLVDPQMAVSDIAVNQTGESGAITATRSDEVSPAVMVQPTADLIPQGTEGNVNAAKYTELPAVQTTHQNDPSAAPQQEETAVGEIALVSKSARTPINPGEDTAQDAAAGTTIPIDASSSADESQVAREGMPQTSNAGEKDRLPVIEQGVPLLPGAPASAAPVIASTGSSEKPVVSIDVTAAAVLSSNLAENGLVEEPVSSNGTDQGKAAELKGKTAAKTGNAGNKTADDVTKVLAGKLEETNNKNSIAAKENANGSDLKKLMDFESNRLQAARLTGNSSETKASVPADNQEAINLAQVVDAATNSSKSLAADLTTSKNPVDLKTLVDQIVQKAELVVKASSSEMKIQLEPEFLGKMTIKIALEDGLLTARFTTDNHQVKQMLENNMSTLRQTLEAQGIKVEKTEVNVQLDNGGTFGGYQEGRQEMWQRPQTPNYQIGSSLETGSYQPGDEELIETAFVQGNYYGIQADGSMNFVV